MKQRVENVAKTIFKKPATKLAHRIMVGTPDIFNPVWEHAERFAERSYQSSVNRS